MLVVASSADLVRRVTLPGYVDALGTSNAASKRRFRHLHYAMRMSAVPFRGRRFLRCVAGSNPREAGYFNCSAETRIRPEYHGLGPVVTSLLCRCLRTEVSRVFVGGSALSASRSPLQEAHSGVYEPFQALNSPLVKCW